MNIENRSTRHPTHKLQPLVRFVCGRARTGRAHLHVSDHPRARTTTTGQAFSFCPHRGIPMIALALGQGMTRYPRVSRHVPEVPAVTLRSWQEEVVLVLAHESRHLWQFRTRAFEFRTTAGRHAAEVDAEQFAVGVLEAYRARKGVRL